MRTLKAGHAAPSFNLKATDGSQYSSREALARGPLLIAFFKVSCPTCQYAFPFIERIFQQLRKRGVQIWSISQDNARDSQGFAKAYGITFPVLIDEHPYEISDSFGIKYVPTLFLINSQGKIELVTDGFAKADFLAIQKWFGQHLSASPPPLFLPSERVPEFKPG